MAAAAGARHALVWPRSRWRWRCWSAPDCSSTASRVLQVDPGFHPGYDPQGFNGDVAQDSQRKAAYIRLAQR